MRRRKDFGQQLGQYFLTRASLIGIVLVMASCLTSIAYRKTSLAWTGGWREAALKAADQGDYRTAQEIWEEEAREVEGVRDVLGAEASPLEERIFPKLKLARLAAEYEELNKYYPGSRDVLLALAQLTGTLGKEREAQEYLNQAIELNPNVNNY